MDKLDKKLEQANPKVFLQTKTGNIYTRVIREPAWRYRFISVCLCTIPPSRFFAYLKPYICAVMTESHRYYNSSSKSKFIMFNRDMTRGRSLTANVIVKCFKPIINAEEAIMGEMRILSSEGDSKLIWDKNSDAEIDAAEAQFDMLVGEKNYKAYHVGKNGKKSDVMKKFDPDAEKMILVPPMVGG